MRIEGGHVAPTTVRVYVGDVNGAATGKTHSTVLGAPSASQNLMLSFLVLCCIRGVFFAHMTALKFQSNSLHIRHALFLNAPPPPPSPTRLTSLFLCKYFFLAGVIKWWRLQKGGGVRNPFVRFSSDPKHLVKGHSGKAPKTDVRRKTLNPRQVSSRLVE